MNHYSLEIEIKASFLCKLWEASFNVIVLFYMAQNQLYFASIKLCCVNNGGSFQRSQRLSTWSLECTLTFQLLFYCSVILSLNFHCKSISVKCDLFLQTEEWDKIIYYTNYKHDQELDKHALSKESKWVMHVRYVSATTEPIDWVLYIGGDTIYCIVPRRKGL